MSQKIMDVLTNSESFNGVSQEGLQSVAFDVNVQYVTLTRGTYLYRSGDLADGFWLIVSGRVLAQTKELRHPFRPVGYNLGAVTGLNGLLHPGMPRPMSMVADGDVELVWVPTLSIRKLTAQDLAIFMENISKILLAKLRSCRSS